MDDVYDLRLNYSYDDAYDRRLGYSYDDTESEYTSFSERPETYIVPIVFAIIFIVGLLGNGALGIIFLRHKSMRNVLNTYVLSLALADLLVILTAVPFTSIMYTLESWPWGGTICRISEFFKDFFSGVSVFTLTALSADRYCVLVNPPRKHQTKPLIVFIAGMIWLLALVFALPAGILSDAQPRLLATRETIYVCYPFPPGIHERTYLKYTALCKAIIYYILPLSIIGVLYALMARKLQLSACKMSGELAGSQINAQAQASNQVARIVMAFVVVFFLCFLPHHVFMLWFHFYPNAEEDYNEWWHFLRVVGFCLSFINSCVNPVAFYCISREFRQHFNRCLCCKASKTIERPHSSTGPSAEVCDTSFNFTVHLN